jgi:ankyrin repeat protein
LNVRNIDGDPFTALVEAIVSDDDVEANRLLDASPLLTKERAVSGATRQYSGRNYFDRIRHYIYEGDTALHMAAAAFRTGIVEDLIARRADVRAKNRRGAEPLHYAVDGGPDVSAWNPTAQAKIIDRLIRAGADPNATDKSGVAPLHRAIRNGCADAVKALIDGGADPNAPNRNGSRPMALATHNTGKSGSGSVEAKEQRERILRILEERGAS